MPETYEVFRYSDDLGGDYETPQLSITTESETEAKAAVRERGGYAVRQSDGAMWSADLDLCGGSWYKFRRIAGRMERVEA